MSTTKGPRRQWLAQSREAINQLPLNELFELPGRPHVVYQIRSYAGGNPSLAENARADMPFLFKAFETGQIGPKRMAKMHGGKPRVATIHEYLDWTITAQSSTEDDELDFGGFRVVVILPRYVSPWPYPGDPGNSEGKKAHPDLGGSLPPFPLLQTHGRPVCAATIRSGPGYLEVPFVATQEHKRGRGYCRCIVEAIEEIARALKLQKLMLCSTNDPVVKSTWHHLNFDFASEEDMKEWDIPHADLVYLQNTTQMHKNLPPPGQFRPVVIKHKDFKQRTYARLDTVVKRPRLYTAPPKKNPPKKPATGKGPALQHTAADAAHMDPQASLQPAADANGSLQHTHAQQEGGLAALAEQGGASMGGALTGWAGASGPGDRDASMGVGGSQARSVSSQPEGSWLSGRRRCGWGAEEPAGLAEGVSGSAWSQQPWGATSQRAGMGPPGKGQPTLLAPLAPDVLQQQQQQSANEVKVEPGREEGVQGHQGSGGQDVSEHGPDLKQECVRLQGEQQTQPPLRQQGQSHSPGAAAQQHPPVQQLQPPLAWDCRVKDGVQGVQLGGAPGPLGKVSDAGRAQGHGIANGTLGAAAASQGMGSNGGHIPLSHQQHAQEVAMRLLASRGAMDSSQVASLVQQQQQLLQLQQQQQQQQQQGAESMQT